jgi:two-component system nitrogen regulation sensor histidine kinase GlnL
MTAPASKGNVPQGIVASNETNAATAPAPELPGGLVSPTGARRHHVAHDLLLAALPHPILVLGDDERVLYANPAAETFFEASLAHMRRMRLEEMVGFGCPILALVREVRRSGVTINEYGVAIATPKVQTQRLIDVHSGPLPETPELTLLMLQHRSIAQMIERQLTHRAAARSVSGLAAVLAHEIKNPLSGIRGAAQLLEPGLSEEDRQLAELICSETDRIRNLVDRMEVFGDERPLTTEPVNIHSILDHVLKLADTGFARGCRLVSEYDPSLPTVAVNRDKLIQAFLNLVKNATESIAQRGESGRIIIRTSFRPGVRLAVKGSDMRVSLPLCIEVEDDGPGVPEAIRPHLFDPFVTTKHSGTGLGLALVAKIIGDHGGVIECDSEPPRTIFRVLLPMPSRGGLPRRNQG